MRTVKEYWDYKNRVEAKASGDNVHKVNGLLGNILNRVARFERHDAAPVKQPYWATEDQDDQRIIEQCQTDIAILTNVHP